MIYLLIIGLYLLSYVLAYITLRIVYYCDRKPYSYPYWTIADRRVCLLFSFFGPAIVAAGSLLLLAYSISYVGEKIVSPKNPDEPAKW